MKNTSNYNQPKSLFQLFFDDENTKDNYLKPKATKKNFPPANLSEDKENFYVELSVPGKSKKDFDISLKKRVLVIKSESKEVKSDKLFNHVEFDFSNFERAFNLPTYADLEKVIAKYDNGLLLITIAKKDIAKVNPVKQIEIK